MNDYQDQETWYEVQEQAGPGIRWVAAAYPGTDQAITADTREIAEALRYFYNLAYRARTGVPATTTVVRRRGTTD